MIYRRVLLLPWLVIGWVGPWLFLIANQPIGNDCLKNWLDSVTMFKHWRHGNIQEQIPHTKLAKVASWNSYLTTFVQCSAWLYPKDCKTNIKLEQNHTNQKVTCFICLLPNFARNIASDLEFFKQHSFTPSHPRLPPEYSLKKRRSLRM